MKKTITQCFILGMLLSLTACEQPQEAVAGPRPALVMTITENGAKNIITITGEVKARYESLQGFRVAGKVIKRYVEVGDLVKKGQLLARLDSADEKLTLDANKAEIKAAESLVSLAKDNLARQQQLVNKKFISEAVLDKYQTDYQTAQARLQQARAQSAVTNNQTRYTSLRADRAGVVSMINAEPGQVVSAGQPVVRVINTNDLEVHIPIDESRMQTIVVGDMATMRLWANRAKTYPVKVREISPVADAASRTFLVKLSILEKNKEIRLGSTAGVTFDSAINDALLIPSTAVLAVDGNPIVWVIDAENKAHARQVEVASFRKDGALIMAGLNIGDKIVVAGAQALTEAQIVRPVEQK